MGFAVGVWLLPVQALSSLTAEQAAAKLALGLEWEQGWEDNVYFQNNSSLAGQESWVSRIKPQLSWQAAEAREEGFLRDWKLSYAPQIELYWEESEESHVMHVLQQRITLGVGDFVFRLENQAAWVQGSDQAPVFDGPGGGPAIGGAVVRDRRDQWKEQAQAVLEYRKDPWLLRMQAALLVNDYGTEQKLEPGYQNYTDRMERSVGLELGREVVEDLHLLLGVRCGDQDQEFTT
ncbi:MAG: hypothetical protein HC904_07675, partial [Blastochloris sp.]|nr:hypothetical protein [Blastochloris sp.]